MAGTVWNLQGTTMDLMIDHVHASKLYCEDYTKNKEIQVGDLRQNRKPSLKSKEKLPGKERERYDDKTRVWKKKPKGIIESSKVYQVQETPSLKSAKEKKTGKRGRLHEGKEHKKLIF